MDFWRETRRRLEAIKPIFMLAEWEQRDLHDGAFDASYAESWTTALDRVVNDAAGPSEMVIYYAQHQGSWPSNAMRMTFVSNHDHNHAVGTEYERFGEALRAAIVLSTVGEGIPLIYSGQELGNRKRLLFFDKDLVEQHDTEQGDLYRLMLTLRAENPALWNAPWGAPIERVRTSEPDRVLAFSRTDGERGVVAALNLTNQDVTVEFGSGHQVGQYTDVITGESVSPDPGWTTKLPAWGFRVLAR